MVMVLVALGCGKGPVKEKGGDTTPPPAAGTPDPKFVSSAGGTNPAIPNQNGNLTVRGGEGVQSARMAAARTINNAQLKQLHLGMFQTWLSDNAMPGINEIMADVKQNRQLLPLIQEEVVILTGTKLGNAVWAYSQYPQRNGNHYVVLSEGVVEMSPTDLKSRLTQEKSPIKMSQ